MKSAIYRKCFCFALVCGLVASLPLVSFADLHNFRLTGNAGDGLLQGNIDPPTGEPGTGGLGAGGITYDDQTNLLQINVVWGSQYGFNDLSQDVMRLHLHGATPDSAPNNFGQTAPLLVNLTQSLTFNPTASGGGVDDTFFINESDEQALLDGRFYVNVHLTSTDTGFIRGYLVSTTAIPEPATFGVLSLLAGSVLLRRRRRVS